MTDTQTGEPMEEGGFQCTALTDYFSAAMDELDLRAGAIYTIIQTSPSGWWYAEDEDGQDGWVPCNYLVRLEEAEEEDVAEETQPDHTRTNTATSDETSILIGDPTNAEDEAERKRKKAEKNAKTSVKAYPRSHIRKQ